MFSALPAQAAWPHPYIDSYIDNDFLGICGIRIKPAESSALLYSECTYTYVK
jgi:hypothetical protein